MLLLLQSAFYPHLHAEYDFACDSRSVLHTLEVVP